MFFATEVTDGVVGVVTTGGLAAGLLLLLPPPPTLLPPKKSSRSFAIELLAVAVVANEAVDGLLVINVSKLKAPGV